MTVVIAVFISALYAVAYVFISPVSTYNVLAIRGFAFGDAEALTASMLVVLTRFVIAFGLSWLPIFGLTTLLGLLARKIRKIKFRLVD